MEEVEDSIWLLGLLTVIKPISGKGARFVCGFRVHLTLQEQSRNETKRVDVDPEEQKEQTCPVMRVVICIPEWVSPAILMLKSSPPVSQNVTVFRGEVLSKATKVGPPTADENFHQHGLNSKALKEAHSLLLTSHTLTFPSFPPKPGMTHSHEAILAGSCDQAREGIILLRPALSSSNTPLWPHRSGVSILLVSVPSGLKNFFGCVSVTYTLMKSFNSLERQARPCHLECQAWHPVPSRATVFAPCIKCRDVDSW